MQWLPASEARDRLAGEPLRTRVADEMSDVLIYLVTLADKLDMDLGSGCADKDREVREASILPARFVGSLQLA